MFSRTATRFRCASAVLTIALLSSVLSSLLAEEADVSFDAILAELRARPIDGIWDPVSRLIRRGRENPGAVRKQLENLLKDRDEKVRLGAAHALCQLNEPVRAGKVLSQLVARSGDAELRRAAANVLAVSALPDDDLSIPETILKALKKEADPRVRLSAARVLYRAGYRAEAGKTLGELLSDEQTLELRDEAVLTLAHQGWLRPREEWVGLDDEALCSKVFERISELRLEPTPRGEQAADLFREMEENRSRVGDAKLVRGERLLRELLLRVLTAYPDKEKCDLDKLFEQAGKGLIASLDPYCQYLDEAEVIATQEMLRQDYGGIGAYVGLRDQVFTVLQPIYDAPAYRAGLRALDAILEVDGCKTTDALQKGGITDVIGKLKGAPGSTVRVKFFRRGFAKPVEVDIVRDVVHIQSAHVAMLPGHVGYVRLTRFGEQSDDEIGEALKTLSREGAQGLILDLRDNPGGLLRAAIDIADRFLAGGKLIVYSEGRESFAPRKDFRSGGGADDERLPLVVLVNSGSASASEIVAGCMQDQHRATLVGEKTFGKGSVQQIIPLRTTDGRTQVRMTVAKYYLPSGRCIHGRGVDPDIAAGNVETDDYLLRRVFELRRTHVFEDYARALYTEHKDALRSVIEDDGGKTDGYPGFDAWVKGLGAPPLPDETVRLEVRQVLRRMAQDEQKREYACDLSSDEVLQRGVLELLHKMNVEPASIARYKDLPARFKETAATEKALTALPVDEHTPPANDLPEK